MSDIFSVNEKCVCVCNNLHSILQCIVYKSQCNELNKYFISHILSMRRILRHNILSIYCVKIILWGNILKKIISIYDNTLYKRCNSAWNNTLVQFTGAIISSRTIETCKIVDLPGLSCIESCNSNSNYNFNNIDRNWSWAQTRKNRYDGLNNFRK